MCVPERRQEESKGLVQYILSIMQHLLAILTDGYLGLFLPGNEMLYVHHDECSPHLFLYVYNGANVFLFSVVFTPSTPSHHGSVWVLPVISLLLINTVSPVRGLSNV